MTTADPRSSPFWRFSLRFYREPGVAEACIALQEEAGVDVNLLLFLLWHATHAHALTARDVASLEARIGAWREMTVVPLRKVRRELKSPPALVASGAAEAFRTRIKAVELEAERLQQEAMYDLARSALLGRQVQSPDEAARSNVAAYEANARPFPKPAVETLLAAFTKLERKPEE
jgi:uncharacterized protein (TIGR02444 family)